MQATSELNTFKTEVDFDIKDSQSSRPTTNSKPVIANLVALRETFLSEAPFVNRSNKLFWSKWIESKEYVAMLSSAIVYIQQCLSDGGTVNLDKLNDITNSSHIVDMSSSLADMFFLQNPRERDVFFNRLPEVLCFMVIHSLHIWNGRNYRVYNSIRFRELLLDFLNELICGFRPTDSKRNSQWIFQDAVDTHIVTSSANATQSASQATLQRRTGGNLNKLASAQSTYTIGHSPLISAHLGVQTQKHPLQNCVKLTLCHLPNRPLMCLTDTDLLKNVRERKITADMIKSTMLNSQIRKSELKRTYVHSKVTMKQDKQMLRESLKTNLAILDNVPVSSKRMVQAALATNSSISNQSVALPSTMAATSTQASVANTNTSATGEVSEKISMISSKSQIGYLDSSTRSIGSASR